MTRRGPMEGLRRRDRPRRAARSDATPPPGCGNPARPRPHAAPASADLPGAINYTPTRRPLAPLPHLLMEERQLSRGNPPSPHHLAIHITRHGASAHLDFPAHASEQGPSALGYPLPERDSTEWRHETMADYHEWEQEQQTDAPHKSKEPNEPGEGRQRNKAQPGAMLTESQSPRGRRRSGTGFSVTVVSPQVSRAPRVAILSTSCWRSCPGACPRTTDSRRGDRSCSKIQPGTDPVHPRFGRERTSPAKSAPRGEIL